MGVIGLVANRVGNCVEAAAAVAPTGLEYDCKSVDSAGELARGDLGARDGLVASFAAVFVGANDCFGLCASNRD